MKRITVDIDKRIPHAFRLFIVQILKWYFNTYFPNENHHLKIGIINDEDEEQMVGDDCVIDAGRFWRPDHIELNYIFLHKDLITFLHSIFHELEHYKVYRSGKDMKDGDHSDFLALVWIELGTLDRYRSLKQEKYCNISARKVMEKFLTSNQPMVKKFIKEHHTYCLTKGIEYTPFLPVSDKHPEQWKQ